MPGTEPLEGRGTRGRHPVGGLVHRPVDFRCRIGSQGSGEARYQFGQRGDALAWLEEGELEADPAEQAAGIVDGFSGRHGANWRWGETRDQARRLPILAREGRAGGNHENSLGGSRKKHASPDENPN